MLVGRWRYIASAVCLVSSVLWIILPILMQEAVSRALLEPSRRVDVATSLVPDYVLPQPGVKYDIDQYSEEWQREVAPKLEERLQKALGK
jgi:hypothetical protein